MSMTPPSPADVAGVASPTLSWLPVTAPYQVGMMNSGDGGREEGGGWGGRTRTEGRGRRRRSSRIKAATGPLSRPRTVSWACGREKKISRGDVARDRRPRRFLACRRRPAVSASPPPFVTNLRRPCTLWPRRPTSRLPSSAPSVSDAEKKANPLARTRMAWQPVQVAALPCVGLDSTHGVPAAWLELRDPPVEGATPRAAAGRR